MSTRLGSTEMAAFQICLQLWVAASLLADGLAVAGQVILAGAFARQDYTRATATAARELQLALAMGLVLSLIVGVGLSFSSGVFTTNAKVLRLLSLGIPFVAATQPINTIAFVLLNGFGSLSKCCMLVVIILTLRVCGHMGRIIHLYGFTSNSWPREDWNR
ncbi:unnamed protein product [Lactuca saligna]|uniref:Protein DETOXIFICATION n=1 Tax=Lactuca saligna TaxID=75948 RepID=A0AA35Y9Y0_LACSI|nr:unnamed protein product [Lactuca saligna]